MDKIQNLQEHQTFKYSMAAGMYSCTRSLFNGNKLVVEVGASIVSIQ